MITRLLPLLALTRRAGLPPGVRVESLTWAPVHKVTHRRRTVGFVWRSAGVWWAAAGGEETIEPTKEAAIARVAGGAWAVWKDES